MRVTYVYVKWFSLKFIMVMLNIQWSLNSKNKMNPPRYQHKLMYSMRSMRTFAVVITLSSLMKNVLFCLVPIHDSFRNIFLL